MVNERGFVDLSTHSSSGDTDNDQPTGQAVEQLRANLILSRRNYVKSLDKRVIESPLAAVYSRLASKRKPVQSGDNQPPAPVKELSEQLAEHYLDDLSVMLEHEIDPAHAEAVVDNAHLTKKIGDEWHEFGAVQATYGNHNKDASPASRLAPIALYGAAGVAVGVGVSVVHLGPVEPALIATGAGVAAVSKRTRPSRKDIEQSFDSNERSSGVSDAEARVTLLMNSLNLEPGADPNVVQRRAIDWMNDNKKKYRIGTYSQVEKARYEAVKGLDEQLDEPDFDVQKARVALALKLMLIELEAMQDKQLKKVEHNRARIQRICMALAATGLTYVTIVGLTTGSDGSDKPKEQPTEQISPPPTQMPEQSPPPTKGGFNEAYPGTEG